MTLLDRQGAPVHEGARGAGVPVPLADGRRRRHRRGGVAGEFLEWVSLSTSSPLDLSIPMCSITRSSPAPHRGDSNSISRCSRAARIICQPSAVPRTEEKEFLLAVRLLVGCLLWPLYPPELVDMLEDKVESIGIWGCRLLSK